MRREFGQKKKKGGAGGEGGGQAIPGLTHQDGVHVEAVLTSLNAIFLPISRSRFEQRLIFMLITTTTVCQFRVNFWVIFGHFGNERGIFSQRIG